MKKYLLIFCIALGNFSCVKKWDAPPVPESGRLIPNITLRELARMHFPGNTEQIIDDYIAEAVVVANDSLDNFYKTIVVQDSTGGISIKMDATALYLLFPVGMKVYIRLKGCWLGDYGGLLQLGGGTDRSDSSFPNLLPIPLPLVKQVMVTGERGLYLNPIEADMQQLSENLENCLVRLKGVEFIAADTARPLADVFNRQSVNHVLTSCNQGSLYLRTSGFARFASVKTPKGNGTITGIYTVFGWQKQLIIRDTTDLDMNGLRCTGAGFLTHLAEDFDLLRPGSVLSLTGWKNMAEAGGRLFYIKSNGNERYASIEAFACGEPAVVSWLISPAIPLNGVSGARLSFDTRAGFDNGARLEVLVSTQYDGSAVPGRFRWTPLAANIAVGSPRSQSLSWSPSGQLSLSGFRGNIRLAFRYTGSDTGTNRRTTTFHLDRVRVLSN